MSAGAETNGEYRAGLAALVGRPNVGKSTLLNALIGQRLSIVTPKPQTTRHRILGIHSFDAGQIVYVDTPGLHRGERRAMNRVLNRAARGALADVQVAVLVIEALRWVEEDQLALDAAREAGVPLLVAINKVDTVKDKGRLLPFIADLSRREGVAEIFPISARKRIGLEALEAGVLAQLPPSPPLYDPEEFTDRSERFLAAELVREQLMRQLGDELPYSCSVEIERFEDDKGMSRIAAVVWVERSSQKGIVIGAGGERLKQVGQQARVAMERLFGRKVFLELWCKVREGWSDDEAALRQLGYGD